MWQHFSAPDPMRRNPPQTSFPLVTIAQIGPNSFGKIKTIKDSELQKTQQLDSLGAMVFEVYPRIAETSM